MKWKLTMAMAVLVAATLATSVPSGADQTIIEEIQQTADPRWDTQCLYGPDLEAIIDEQENPATLEDTRDRIICATASARVSFHSGQLVVRSSGGAFSDFAVPVLANIETLHFGSQGCSSFGKCTWSDDDQFFWPENEPFTETVTTLGCLGGDVTIQVQNQHVSFGDGACEKAVATDAYAPEADDGLGTFLPW